MAVELAASRSYPGGVARAFDVVLPAPLPFVFERRYLAIPPIREVRDDGRVWGEVGQQRTIVLADGGTMVETLTHLDRPDVFGYRIDRLTGPLAPIATHLDGRWSFEPAGNGVRITWSWVLHPRGRAASLLMPAFTRMWQGYARQGLENIERLLAR